jgi:glycolate oxidase
LSEQNLLFAKPSIIAALQKSKKMTGGDPMQRFSYNPIQPSIIEELINICGRRFVLFEDKKRLYKYSHDQVPEKKYAHFPEVVVFPKTAAEISDLLKLANREKIPITPRGAGSGLSGGAVPVYGGILLSLERLDKIIEIDTDNLMAVVEPGVVTNKLDEALKDYGLFFAGYPMSEEFCFLGGNVAENAGGGRAVKYGVTGRYICGLEVVTPTGDIVQMGGKRIKDVTGYDLVHLMVGSEGTLGIFTKIFIRLLPRPSIRQALLSFFENAEAAISILPRVITDGKLIPSAIEFIDGFCFAETGKGLKEKFSYDRIGSALLFEVDGSSFEVVHENVATIRKICTEHGAIENVLAVTADEVERFWKIRKAIPWQLKRISPYQSIEDIVVPIAGIPQILQQLKSIGQKYDILIPVFGHAADGNLHATPLKNPGHSPDHWEKILPAILKDIYTATALLGGTISGEHGIGHKRMDYMQLVMSSTQIEIMRRIKLALDPNNILNPGKIMQM